MFQGWEALKGMTALYGQRSATLIPESRAQRASGIIGALGSGEDLEAAVREIRGVGRVIGVADRLW
jgi:hypothetical protein